MKKIGLIYFVLIAGCAGLTRKPEPVPRAPASLAGGYEVKPPVTIPEEQELNFEKFKQLILGGKFTSVEESLQALSQSYSDYMKFHTLMYNSLSIQQSSFEEPRAIVFGPEARFIFTFNGNLEQMGGHSFETVEYSAAEHAFRFREIAFKHPGFKMDELSLDPGEVEYEDKNLVISKANPAKCLLCHGQNASPVWQTYFLWPGAYGSDDDQIGMSFVKSTWNPNNQGFFEKTGKPSSLGRIMAYKPGAPDTELQGLIRYVNGKPKHARYKWLPATITETAAAAYGRGVPFDQLDFSAQAGEESKRYAAEGDVLTRPNVHLLNSLQRLNSDRLIHRMQQAGIARDAFASPDWVKLSNYDTDPNKKIFPPKAIPELTLRIEKLLAHFQFQKQKPTRKQVAETLRKNLADEFEMQQDRIRAQVEALGPLQLQTYVSGGQDAPAQKGREFVSWIPNAKAFYMPLLKMKNWTDLDTIAAHMETDNQVLNTGLQLLLADRGIDLHDFTTNYRQRSVAEHDFGLSLELDYLGIQKKSQQ